MEELGELFDRLKRERPIDTWTFHRGRKGILTIRFDMTKNLRHLGKEGTVGVEISDSDECKTDDSEVSTIAYKKKTQYHINRDYNRSVGFVKTNELSKIRHKFTPSYAFSGVKIRKHIDLLPGGAPSPVLCDHAYSKPGSNFDSEETSVMSVDTSSAKVKVPPPSPPLPPSFNLTRNPVIVIKDPDRIKEWLACRDKEHEKTMVCEMPPPMPERAAPYSTPPAPTPRSTTAPSEKLVIAPKKVKVPPPPPSLPPTGLNLIQNPKVVLKDPDKMDEWLAMRYPRASPEYLEIRSLLSSWS